MTRPVPVRFYPEQGKHVKSMQMSGLCEHVSGSGKVMVYVSDSQENSSSERIPQVQRKGMTVHNKNNHLPFYTRPYVLFWTDIVRSDIYINIFPRIFIMCVENYYYLL